MIGSFKYLAALVAFSAFASDSSAQCQDGSCKIPVGRAVAPQRVQQYQFLPQQQVQSAPARGRITFTDGSIGEWDARLGAYVIVSSAPSTAVVPTPMPTAKPVKDTVVGFSLGELRHKAAMQHLRTLAIASAVQDGITQPDGSVKRVTFAQARERVNRISDDTIRGGAIGLGAPVSQLGDGTFLKWIWDHRDEIVKFILSIVALFGSD